MGAGLRVGGFGLRIGGLHGPGMLRNSLHPKLQNEATYGPVLKQTTGGEFRVFRASRRLL